MIETLPSPQIEALADAPAPYLTYERREVIGLLNDKLYNCTDVKRTFDAVVDSPARSWTFTFNGAVGQTQVQWARH